MKEASPYIGRNMTRRNFALGGAALIGATALYLGADPQTRTGFEVAMNRLDRPDYDNKKIAEMVGSIPETTYQQVWQENINGREKLLPYTAWYKNEQTSLIGIGQGLALLATTYYEKEKANYPQFADYYPVFVKQLHETALTAELDFVTLASTLLISAENLSHQPLAADVKESIVQTALIPTLRRINLLNPVLDFVDQAGIYAKVVKLLPESEQEPFLKYVISYFDRIRIVNAEVTTGAMDYETGERALSYISAPAPIKEQFTLEYPAIASKYEKIATIRSELEKTRNQMETLANEYLLSNPNVLKEFATGNKQDLAAIGISQPLNGWQLNNPTYAWVTATDTYDDEKPAYDQIVEKIISAATEDHVKFNRDFMSQQILNPEFMKYLKQKDQQTPNLELSSLPQLDKTVNRFNEISCDLVLALYKTQAMERDCDSRFQLQASVMTTKRLADMIGSPNLNNVNEYYYFLYKMTAIREIAPVNTLVSGTKFARSSLIDSPYAHQDVLDGLNNFVEILIQQRIITTSPDRDIHQFRYTVEGFRQRNKAYFMNIGRITSEKQWNDLIHQFDRDIIKRYGKNTLGTGFIHKSPNIKDLEQLLKNKGLISKHFQADRSSFYQTLWNLNPPLRYGAPKFELYPWLSMDDQTEILTFMANNTPDIVKSTQNEKIGWGEYPPYVRSQHLTWVLMTNADGQPT